MYDVPKFLKRDKDSLLFNQKGELVFYVPEMYFERKFALMVGDYVNLIGVLDYAVFDEKGKSSGLKQFRFPTVFLARPSEMEKSKNVKLTKNSPEQDYRLLKFKQGDQVIVSVKVPQMVDNAEEFFKIFNSGKLPNTIPYNEIQNYFLENIRLNGADYGITAQLFGIMISESFRDINNPKILFRHTNMKDMNAYSGISVKSIPKYVSPSASITSENWDESLMYAMLNENPKYTPLEKLLTT